MLIGRYSLLSLCFCAALLIAVLPASADTISYTDPNAWGNVTTGVQDITFAGIAPLGSFTGEGTSSGYQIDGASFVGYLTNNTYMLNIVDQLDSSPYYSWGVPATLQSPIYNLPANPPFVPYVQVNLPANTTAFSVDLGTVSPNGLTYQITLSNGQVFTVNTANRPNLTFFGITADSPITYADFVLLNPGTFSGSYGLMANFEFGTSTIGQQQTGGSGDVPEAATLIMIGFGLVTMRTLRKHLPTFV